MNNNELALYNEKTELLNKVGVLLVKLKKLEEAKEIFKEELFEAMQKYNVEKFTFGEVTASITKETVTEKLNSQKLKAKYPEIYDDCVEPSKRKAYLTLRLSQSPKMG